MASVKTIKRKRGVAFQVAFTLHGRRRWLSLGSNYTRGDAHEIARNVEAIVSAIVVGREVDRRVETWLALLPEDLKSRLERVGLVERRRDPTLEELVAAYFENESKFFKSGTIKAKTGVFKKVFKFIDKTIVASSVTKMDAINFVSRLTSAGVCEATRGGIIRDLRRLYNWAINAEILVDNPFNAVKRGAFANKSRETFISRETYNRLLDACPTQELRAVLALYRIGGLRRGEAFALNWRDVDFARGRLLVRSPKTERHTGQDRRVVPLFPELRAELERLWDITPEGGPAKILRTNYSTVYKRLEFVVFQAGLTRWERLIQNLRSSRAIEIEREFGSLAESEWLGHNPATARRHYLHVLEEEYDRAAAGTTAKTTAPILDNSVF